MSDPLEGWGKVGDACSECGTAYAACMLRIRGRASWSPKNWKACCGACSYRDTHNERKKSVTAGLSAAALRKVQELTSELNAVREVESIRSALLELCGAGYERLSNLDLVRELKNQARTEVQRLNAQVKELEELRTALKSACGPGYTGDNLALVDELSARCRDWSAEARRVHEEIRELKVAHQVSHDAEGILGTRVRELSQRLSDVRDALDGKRTPIAHDGDGTFERWEGG